MWTPPRSDKQELLDVEKPNRDDLVVNLNDMALANRFLGTSRHLVDYMEELLRCHQGADTLYWLDVGTGGANIPLVVAQWEGWRARRLQVVVSDLNWDVLAIARDNLRSLRGPMVETPLIVQHDASRMPLGDGSVDIVSCCNTLHHLGYDRAVALLREAERICRLGFVIIDLRRSLINYVILRLLATLGGAEHRLSRHDGPLSVLRSFTGAELAMLVADAGVPSVKIRHYAWQVALMRDKKTD